MPEDGIIGPELAAKIAELQRLDERDRQRSLARAEGAVPPTEELVQYGPVPPEYTPVPGPASLGPGGMGPRVEIDPRFGEYPGIPSALQKYSMTEPRGNPERERDVRKGYANPASVDAYYPAVQDAYLRQRGARAGRAANRAAGSEKAWEDSAWKRLHDEHMDVRNQAWDYTNPDLAAFRERQRLLEGARAQEAARQSGLSEAFGTPEERARTILALTDLGR